MDRKCSARHEHSDARGSAALSYAPRGFHASKKQLRARRRDTAYISPDLNGGFQKSGPGECREG